MSVFTGAAGPLAWWERLHCALKFHWLSELSFLPHSLSLQLFVPHFFSHKDSVWHKEMFRLNRPQHLAIHSLFPSTSCSFTVANQVFKQETCLPPSSSLHRHPPIHTLTELLLSTSGFSTTGRTCVLMHPLTTVAGMLAGATNKLGWLLVLFLSLGVRISILHSHQSPSSPLELRRLTPN